MMKNTFKIQNPLYRSVIFFIFTSFVFLGNPYISCDSDAQNNAVHVQKINRDWSKYPAIIELDTENEIFVIGDIHGDYEGLLELLIAGKIISEIPKKPERVKWKAGNAILMIPGDFVSKGPHSIDVLLLLRELQKSAPKSGGRVILMLGNHEAEFLANPNEKKVEMFKKDLKKSGISPKEVVNGEDKLGIGKFLRNLLFAAKINDWYFVHAGHPKKYSLKELESKIIAGVEKNGFGSPILLDEDDGILEARMEPRPWWEKKNDNSKDSKTRLQELVEELGVKHIVVGHQPGTFSFADGENRKKGKMYQKFNGMIFFIDTGMESKKSDGAMLHIQTSEGKETATVLYPGSKKGNKVLWPE